MGPAPGPTGKLSWPCLLNLEGLPIEYSWKWNASGSKPVIRYTIEAMGQFTGRLVDPLNQDASRELLYRLKDVIPSLDLTWNNHLLATLYDHDRSRYSKEITAGQPFTTTILIAVELSPTGLGVKTYYIPRRLGLGLDQIPLDVWKNAIAGICAGGGASTKLYDFLDNLQSQPLSPAAIAVDNIKPEHSRLKFYFRSPHSTFDAIQEVMTLGGRIPVLPEHLKGLQSLLASLAGTTDALAPDAELDMMPQQATLSQNSSAYAPLVLPGCGYYFNIASDLEYPEIKVFINLYIYGPDDLVLTERISKWMIEHGRGEYCTQYASMLECLLPHRSLADGKGVHTYLSCLFKGDGGLEITCYLKPEISAGCIYSRPVLSQSLRPVGW